MTWWRAAVVVAAGTLLAGCTGVADGPAPLPAPSPFTCPVDAEQVGRALAREVRPVNPEVLRGLGLGGSVGCWWFVPPRAPGRRLPDTVVEVDPAVPDAYGPLRPSPTGQDCESLPALKAAADATVRYCRYYGANQRNELVVTLRPADPLDVGWQLTLTAYEVSVQEGPSDLLGAAERLAPLLVRAG